MGSLIAPSTSSSRSFATSTSSFDKFVELTVDRKFNKGSLILDDKGGLKCVGHHFWKLAANSGSSPSIAQERSVRDQFQLAVDTELSFHLEALLVQDQGKSEVEQLKQKFNDIKAIFDNQIQNGGEGRSHKFNRMAIGKIAQNVRWFVNNMSVERLLTMSPQDLASLVTDKSARQRAEKVGANEVDTVEEPIAKPRHDKFSKLFDQLDALKNSDHKAGEVVKCVRHAVVHYINQELFDYSKEFSSIAIANDKLKKFNNGQLTRGELENAVDKNLLVDGLWHSPDRLQQARKLVADLKSGVLEPKKFVDGMADVFRNELSARRESISGKYNAIFAEHGIQTLAFRKSGLQVVLDVENKEQPLSDQTLDDLKKLLNIFVNDGSNNELRKALNHEQEIKARLADNEDYFYNEVDFTSTVVSSLEEELAKLSGGDSTKVSTKNESDSTGKVGAKSDWKRRLDIVGLLKTADQASQAMDKMKGLALPIASIIEAAKDTLLDKIYPHQEVARVLDDITTKLFDCQNQLDFIPPQSKPVKSENPSPDSIDATQVKEGSENPSPDSFDDAKLKDGKIVFSPLRVSDEVNSILNKKSLENFLGKDKMLERIKKFESDYSKSPDQAKTSWEFVSDMLKLAREASANIAKSVLAMNKPIQDRGITTFAFLGQFRASFVLGLSLKNSSVIDEKAIDDFKKLIDAFTGKDMKFRKELGLSITDGEAKTVLSSFNGKLENLVRQNELAKQEESAKQAEMDKQMELAKQGKMPPKAMPADMGKVDVAAINKMIQDMDPED